MATRDVTPAVATQAAAQQKAIILFADFDFSSGFLRLTNASHDVDWNGQTWRGVGALGRIEQAKEVLDIEAVGLAMTIAGVDPTKIQVALTEHYQQRASRAWMGFIASGGIVADPVLFFSGRMDTMPIKYSPEECAITVNVESRFAGWNRPRIRRFTDADQQAEFPGDLGAQYVEEVASGIQVIWGRG